MPGILLAFGSGAVALVTDDARLETALAVPFGAGIGLTFDEAALLLDLRDVYWTREGMLSVQVSLGLAAMLGGTILALRMLRRGEERVEAQRPDPACLGRSCTTRYARRARRHPRRARRLERRSSSPSPSSSSPGPSFRRRASGRG